MIIKIRKFTELGLKEFEIYLREELDNSQKFVTRNLNVYPYSQEITSPKKILINPQKEFRTRLDLGSYLNQKLIFGGISRENVFIEEPESWDSVWSWLAFIWVKQFVKITDETFNVPAIDRFIGSSDFRRFYRHFVATPYWLYSLHGEEFSKLFLDCPVNIHNEFTEQIGSRQWIVSSRNLVKLAHKLYWDNEKDRAKRGARSKGAGTIRRFGIVLNQLGLNYDTHDMNVNELYNLLPSEFEKWKI